MKKINIILSTIFVFFFSHNLAIAKSECDDLLGTNKMALNMTVGFGTMYFNGYNHAKGSNIKYSKSKMKEYIRVSCAADNNIKIEKIFANAADTNFKLPKIKKRKKQKVDLFFIRLDKHWEKNEMDRTCVISKMEKGVQEFLGEKYDELEPLRKKTGKKRYSEKLIKKAFDNDLDGFFKEMQKYFKKCGLM